MRQASDLRRKKFSRPKEIPYEVGPTQPGIASTAFDSGDYPRALEHALERFGWEELKPPQGQKWAVQIADTIDMVFLDLQTSTNRETDGFPATNG